MNIWIHTKIVSNPVLFLKNKFFRDQTVKKV